MDSSSTAIAHRPIGNLHQRSGGTPPRTLVLNAVVPCGWAVGVGHAVGVWQRIGAARPFCTGLTTHARAAHLPNACMRSRYGKDVRAGQQAGELAATHPVNRSQLDRRLELAARIRT